MSIFLMGWFILYELMNVWIVVGMLLVLGGVFLVSVRFVVC